MTHAHPLRMQGARAALMALAFSTLLSACGGGGGDEPSASNGDDKPPSSVATGTDNVNAALSMPPNGSAVATSVDASTPAEPSGPTVIATDSAAAPVATANDAASPSEPTPSAV